MASTATRQETERKNFETPDELREFSNGRAEIVKIGGGEVGRLVLEPGWRWSEHVKPVAGTELCEAPHFQYVASGRVGGRMADGPGPEGGPGDGSVGGPGPQAWVAGETG